MSELETIQLISLTTLALVFSLCLFGVVVSVKPTTRLVVLVLGSPAIYMISLWTWWTLIYGQTVPIDRIFAKFGIHLSDQGYNHWVIWIILLPPLLPTIFLACAFFYVRWRIKRNVTW